MRRHQTSPSLAPRGRFAPPEHQRAATQKPADHPHRSRTSGCRRVAPTGIYRPHPNLRGSGSSRHFHPTRLPFLPRVLRAPAVSGHYLRTHQFGTPGDRVQFHHCDRRADDQDHEPAQRLQQDLGRIQGRHQARGQSGPPQGCELNASAGSLKPRKPSLGSSRLAGATQPNAAPGPGPAQNHYAPSLLPAPPQCVRGRLRDTRGVDP